jgi:nucleotide-binding universal stress UspA family protein
MMKTILVLTDFSYAAYRAALYASALTHQLEADQLILYHSYELKQPVETVVPLPEPPDIERLYQESIANLTVLKDELRTFVHESSTIDIHTDDRPLLVAAEAIAAEHRAELTVMGITGKSNIEKALFGSNTLMMAKESTIPVLLVPPEARFEWIKRVVFACDLKNISQSTPAKSIRSLVHALNAKLLVLNVDTEDHDHFTPDTIHEQTLLDQLWDREDPEYHFHIHEDTAEGILQFTLEHNIQLLIAVPKQHTFFDRLLHGSLTKKLTFQTLVPLLLMKEINA